ncbi:thermonuclease family protein [Pseudobutyrivibrio xylanivorans]|uniref:Thermonuclease family protein n=1 Tax=Pseudobutyrivibrio xylanivorans TaxID=185007 RepID=A0A5P6VSQ8_PSEXY|nr:thermonuclease family protein [Pseudobutyrivibrio xylanivorans]QFJ55626.1 thermonuclease family protein [Pseudobutyrivibrio xylanivorans]
MKTQLNWQRLGIIIVAILIGVGVPEFFMKPNTVNVEHEEPEVITGETSISSLESENKLDAVKFVRCVDGDTIIVDDGSGEHKRVRMIGIDTPESVAKEEERNNEYGVMASDYTKALLADADTLYLEYDVDSDDQYDRILAYVWLEDVSDTFNEENIEKSMVNAIIVKDGYGVAKRYEPTVAHDSTLKALMEKAKANNTGLWQYQGFVELWQ